MPARDGPWRRPRQRLTPATNCATEASDIRSVVAPTTLIVPAIASGRFALGEQRQHVLGAQPPGRLPHLPEHRIQLVGAGAREVLGEPAQQVEEGGRLQIRALPGGPLFELRHQLLELGRVANQLQQRIRRRVVQLDLRTGQRCGEDLVDGRGQPLLLTQYLGIVNLDDLETGSPGRGPETRDATIGAHLLGRARQEQQENLPGGGVRAGVHRQGADQVPVEDLSELGECRVRLGRDRAIEQQGPGPDLQTERPGLAQSGRGLGQASKGGANGGMAAGVKRHRARRRLAGAGEFREPRGGFGRELRWRRLWRCHQCQRSHRDRSAIRCGVGAGRRVHVGPREARRKIPGGNGITSDILAVAVAGNSNL